MTADKDSRSVPDDAALRQRLSPEEYRVTREKGTEAPFTGRYWPMDDTVGVYHCKCCGEALFLSDAKFDAGCGWPSFFQPLNDRVISEHEDLSLGMRRMEIVCSRCDAHLGHVFNDGPPPTGLRYCVNSVSLDYALNGETDFG